MTIEEKGTELKKALLDLEMLQIINLDHEKTIEEKDVELRRLRCEIDAIHNSISWRTLTPIKKYYELIFQVNKK